MSHRRAVRAALLAVVAGTAAVCAPPSLGAQPEVAAFRTYASPPGMGDSAGEPSLGVDPRNGTVLFQALYETLAVTDFDERGAGTATWRDVSYPGFVLSLDPILATDSTTGRTWASQLQGPCSQTAYTDDDGASWHEVPLGCSLLSGVDHQTIGAGPFPEAAPLASATGAKRAVYYCSQQVVTQGCGVSVDGGATFLPGQPIATSPSCTGYGPFGHVKVGRDGTAYVPIKWCQTSNGLPGFQRGLAISRDGGASWSASAIPGTDLDDSMDASVAPAKDGTVYFAAGIPETDAGGGPIAVSVSSDRGRTWGQPVKVGKDLGIVQTRFPAMVAGNGARAAVAYLGSTEFGDGSGDLTWSGTWRLYVSYTLDRGRTWSTAVATPRSPVQVGPICTGGTTCDGGGATGDTRNLLDFIDATLDRSGRVVVAFADGCLQDSGCTTSDRRAKATIARQVSGPSLTG